MPSWELFERQPRLPRLGAAAGCRKRIAVEAGVSMGWDRYIGPKGRTVTLDRFGASGPYKELAVKFGFTAEHIVEVARNLR